MFFKPKAEVPQYISAEVSRGDIEDSVLATGVLEATKMVSVGAQVSGQVKKMWDEEDPSVEYLMTQGAPLMVPADPNASFLLTVVP